MLAFAGLPKMELPAYSREKKPRIFELRTYESYSEAKALKKVAMFNAGEVETMREVGLGPIFFGQALIGPSLPHLTYMLSAESQDLHKQHFAAFGKHPTGRNSREILSTPTPFPRSRVISRADLLLSNLGGAANHAQNAAPCRLNCWRWLTDLRTKGPGADSAAAVRQADGFGRAALIGPLLERAEILNQIDQVLLRHRLRQTARHNRGLLLCSRGDVAFPKARHDAVLGFNGNLVSRFAGQQPKRLIPVLQFDLPGFKAKGYAGARIENRLVNGFLG